MAAAVSFLHHHASIQQQQHSNGSPCQEQNTMMIMTARSRTASSLIGRRTPRSTTSLSAKSATKKKQQQAVGGKKVQVKLLKHVSGTGHIGDVIMVSSAFYHNKLRPSQSAIIITDDEVEQEQKVANEKRQLSMDRATSWKDKINGSIVTIRRKAGPEGQLFGAVNTKCIVDEINKHASTNKGDDILDANNKGVKIISLQEQDDSGDGTTSKKKIRGDIKHIGEYKATIQLMNKDTTADFTLSVVAEK